MEVESLVRVLLERNIQGGSGGLESSEGAI